MTPILPVHTICQSVVTEYGSNPLPATLNTEEKAKIQATLENIVGDLREKGFTKHFLRVIIRNFTKFVFYRESNLNFGDIAHEPHTIYEEVKLKTLRVLHTLDQLMPIDPLLKKGHQQQIFCMLLECLLKQENIEKRAKFNLEKGRAFLAKHFSEKDNPTSFSELLLTLKLMTEYGGSEHLIAHFADFSLLPATDAAPIRWYAPVKRKLDIMKFDIPTLLSANLLFLIMRDTNYFANPESKMKCQECLKDLIMTQFYESTFSVRKFIFSVKGLLITSITSIFIFALYYVFSTIIKL